ncbi:MAG TPA: EamA family transporter [Chthoniobacteraceae bacterium]|nr:EamA family transporter [Chthoniobacteraceae bacterium]
MNQNEKENPGTHKAKPPLWLVLAAFAAVYLIWGSTFLSIRFAIQTIPPLLMAGGRYFTAGVILYGIMWLRGEPAPRLVHWRDATVAGTLFLLLQNAVLSWVEQKTPSALSALVVAATPFWMILLNRLLVPGVRLTLPLLAGLVLGFAGVVVIVMGKNRDGTILVDPLHAGLLFGGSICWAYGTIYSRSARKPANSLQATAMQMIAGGALILVTSAFFGEPGSFHFSNVSKVSWTAFAYLVVFGSLVGYSAYVWLLEVSTIARVSTSAFVNPLVAVILGSTIAHEAISPGIILGGALIIGAVMLITWKQRPRAAAQVPLVSGAASGSVK